jgi:hypothetical protein
MKANERRSDLDRIFASLDDEQRRLISPLLDELVFMEERLTYLRGLPMLRVHPKRPDLQQNTPAARQYKETMQSYMNAIRILCGVLAKTEPSAQDELLKRLEEFSLS